MGEFHVQVNVQHCRLSQGQVGRHRDRIRPDGGRHFGGHPRNAQQPDHPGRGEGDPRRAAGGAADHAHDANRTPGAKQQLYGGPIEEAEAFTTSARARVGHHNDCFLASDSDQGTRRDDGQIEVQKRYLAADTQFVPMGGETCAVNPPRSACPTALAEMQSLHVSFINADYHPDVLKGWKSGGCYPEMDSRLGYRLALTAATLPTVVHPGAELSATLELRNDGWAAPFNPRPLVLVLAQGLERRELPVDSDPRWLPGAHTVRARVVVPADLPPGRYRLALWLPDASPTLRSRPEYAIRLANEEIYDATTGDHTLAMVDVTSK